MQHSQAKQRANLLKHNTDLKFPTNIKTLLLVDGNMCLLKDKDNTKFKKTTKASKYISRPVFFAPLKTLKLLHSIE